MKTNSSYCMYILKAKTNRSDKGGKNVVEVTLLD